MIVKGIFIAVAAAVTLGRRKHIMNAYNQAATSTQFYLYGKLK